MPEAAVLGVDGNILKLDRLARWMDQQGLGDGPIEDLEPLGGGTQNVIVRFIRGGREYVLRRPPVHPRDNSNKTMMREARILQALRDTDVPHPRLIAACDYLDVLGVAFYLMEPIRGFFAPGGLPELHRNSADVRRRMGLSLVEGAASLANLDHVALGLSDFGKTDGYLERQTARWRSQLESYRSYQGWPGPGIIPCVDEVARWLEERIPHDQFRPGIIHGDYHIANVLFDYDSPRLAAIIDWELATLGDPMLDLGWLLATWPDGEGNMPDPAIAVEPWDGFPSAADLVAHYGQCVDRDMSVVPWFAVLACYKLGILLEGTHARACAGKAPMETAERLHGSCVRLFERAMEWIGREGHV